MQRFGAAAHPAQLLLHVQRSDVAPDRRLGDVGQFDQFATVTTGFSWTADRMILMAFFLVHGPLPLVSMLPSFPRSVNHI